MLRNWSGVGGGGMITFLALAHMLDAAQLVRGGWGGGSHSLHLHTCWMLRNWSGVGGGDDHIPCTCTHVGCCATGRVGGGGGMITFLALAHMLDAAQLVRGGWGGDDHISCTCTHVGCYATGRG